MFCVVYIENDFSAVGFISSLRESVSCEILEYAIPLSEDDVTSAGVCSKPLHVISCITNMMSVCENVYLLRSEVAMSEFQSMVYESLDYMSLKCLKSIKCSGKNDSVELYMSILKEELVDNEQ